MHVGRTRGLTQKRLAVSTAIIAFVWTAVFAALLFYEIHHENARAIDLALARIRGVAEREMFWVGGFGGRLLTADLVADLPDSSLVTDNHVSAERECVSLIWRDTASGAHRAYDIGDLDSEGIVQLPGQKPLPRYRAPDAWEVSSLAALGTNRREVFDILESDKKPVMRILRKITPPGGREGDNHATRGGEKEFLAGISVVLSLNSVLADTRTHIALHITTFLVLWGFGLAVLALANYRLSTALQDHLRIQAALRESENRFERIATTQHVGIWELDEHANTSFVNYRMASMLGYSIGEMLNRSMLDFVDEDNRRQASTNFERRRQNIEEQHEFQFQTKDGSSIWTLLSTKPMFDEEGKFKGALGVVTDISSRKRAENALQESEERMRQLIESTGDVVAMQDLDGRFLLVLGKPSILDFKSNDVIGKTSGDLLGDDVGQNNLQRIQEVLRTGRPVYGEDKFTWKGEDAWFHTGWYPVHDANGVVTAISMFSRDVTSQRTAEMKLREAEETLRLERMRTRIAGDLHDDIGSTLSSTSIFNELLVKEIEGQAPRALELADRIRVNLLEVQQALHDIVWTIDPNNDEVENLLLRLQEHANEVLESGGIMLRSSFPEGDAVVRLPMQARRDIYLIVKEVIHNIVKHSFAKKVMIDAEIDGQWLRISIADDGIGFHPSSLMEGNGMRSIRRRCEDAGGMLRVDSIPGQGTLIAFRMPIA